MNPYFKLLCHCAFEPGCGGMNFISQEWQTIGEKPQQGGFGKESKGNLCSEKVLLLVLRHHYP